MRVMLYGMLRFERDHIGFARPWLGLGDPDVSSVMRLPKNSTLAFATIIVAAGAIGTANAEYAGTVHAATAPSGTAPFSGTPAPPPHAALTLGSLPAMAPDPPLPIATIDVQWQPRADPVPAPSCPAARRDRCPIPSATCRRISTDGPIPAFVKEPGAVDRSAKARTAKPPKGWESLYRTEIIFDAAETALSPGNERRVAQVLRQGRGRAVLVLAVADDGSRSEADRSFKRAAAVWAAFGGKATFLALDWRSPLVDEPEPTSRVVAIEVVAPCPS